MQTFFVYITLRFGALRFDANNFQRTEVEVDNCCSEVGKYRRDGVVVRASALQSVDLGFIP